MYYVIIKEQWRNGTMAQWLNGRICEEWGARNTICENLRENLRTYTEEILRSTTCPARRERATEIKSVRESTEHRALSTEHRAQSTGLRGRRSEEWVVWRKHTAKGSGKEGVRICSAIICKVCGKVKRRIDTEGHRLKR